MISSLLLERSQCLFCSDIIYKFEEYSCVIEEADSFANGKQKFIVMDSMKHKMILVANPNVKSSLYEISILENLKNIKGVIQILQKIIEKNYTYYIVNYSKFISLNVILDKSSSLKSLNEIISFFKSLVILIRSINKKGITYGGIAMSNIMVNQNLQPLLIDFSNSRKNGIKTEITGDIMLCSPENIDNLIKKVPIIPEVDTDVYWLGLVLYYLKNKHLPLKRNLVSKQNYLNRYIQFCANENSDYIELIKMCLIKKSLRSTISDLYEQLLKYNLFKKNHNLKTKVRYKINDGNLLYFETKKDQERLAILFIGILVFIVFSIGLMALKCSKSLRRKRERKDSIDYEIEL